MVFDRVVNELTQQHRLADACAPEEAGLTAAFDRGQEVDRLYPCFENFSPQHSF